MSMDNGITIQSKNGKHIVREYCASTGDTFTEKEFKTRDEAIKFAQTIISEYGITFI